MTKAWIEQKNGAVVRRFVGYDRYSGPIAGQTMAHLYGAMRRYVNHFQPSFKLLEKTRDGATVVKRYSPPATPCDRLMQHDTVNEETKEALRQRRAMLDPVALLHTIREAQSALMAVSSPQLRETPQGESLERFLARLPSLWRQGDARPTHAARVRGPRQWRTRKDPFEGVWCDILAWFAGKPGRHGRCVAGTAADGPSRPIHRRTTANVTAQGAAVARHHGQKTGLWLDG